MLSHEECCPRKRRQDKLVSNDIEQQPSAKRRKAASHHYPPRFWDTLSEITLTRKALKEFDRRTAEGKATRVVKAEKKSTRLLRSDTKRLVCSAKNGGPNLSSLRGYTDSLHIAVSMSKASSRSSKRTRDSGQPSSSHTGKTSTTGPYDAQFQRKLIDAGIYPDRYEDVHGEVSKPKNINSLRQLLAKSRRSLSPSQFTDEAFEEFERSSRRAKSESQAMATVIPVIVGSKDSQCETAQDKLFTNLEKFDPDLRAPQPDKYYGARLEQVNKRVHQDLDRYIVPCTDASLPAVPNFFLEGKSASGRADVAQRQVTNDNAYGARAMFQLQNYGKETPVYDGNAYTIGSSFHLGTGTLQMYATHPKQSASGRTEYYMTQLGAYAMTHAPETFRQGTTAWRNCRDYTGRERDQFIANANAVARRLPVVATPSSGSGSRTNLSSATANRTLDSDTSEDELAFAHDAAVTTTHNSEDLGVNARPRKRIARNPNTTHRIHSRAKAPLTNTSVTSSRARVNVGKTQDDETDSSEDSDDDCMAADGDDDGESTDGEDDGVTSNEQNQDPAASRQAQEKMRRLLKQGKSKEEAFDQLVLARQHAQRVTRNTAVAQVRAMLAYRI